MGEAWSDWYAMDYLVAHDLQRDRAGQGRRPAVRLRRRGRRPRPHRADRLQGRPDGAAVQRRRHRPPRRLHLRRLRQRRRRPRGPRRRRDLGADPVGPARRARLEAGRVAGDPGDGAGAVQPVVPRHAQRDPGRRHLGLPRQAAHARSGRSSPAAAWASSPARSAATTRRRAPASRRPPATITSGDHHGHRDRPGQPAHPVVGVTVTLAFQGSGAVNPTAVTDAAGHYTITGVPAGHYSKLQVLGAGYSARRRSPSAPAAPRSTSRSAGPGHPGGRRLDRLARPGPTSRAAARQQAIDQNQATGWSTNVGAGHQTCRPSGTFDPKNLVVDLGATYDVTRLRGRPVGLLRRRRQRLDRRLPDRDVARTAPTWTRGNSGTFTTADNGRINPIDLERRRPRACSSCGFT